MAGRIETESVAELGRNTHLELSDCLRTFGLSLLTKLLIEVVKVGHSVPLLPADQLS